MTPSIMKPTNTQDQRDRGRHAVVAVIVEEDRFLVIQRSEHVRAPGLICFPGGGIEAGEDFTTAIQRELMEELALEVHVQHHVWTSDTRWGTKLEWLVCERKNGSEPVAAPAEVAAIFWLTSAELRKRKDLLGSVPDFLKAVNEGVVCLTPGSNG